MKITKLELWNDTGFVDGAAEVPSMTDVLPTADITITDELRPAKDELFSRLKISSVREQTEETTVFWAFEDLVNVSYVAIKYDRLDYTIYGWVDNVLMISDSPTPVTAIDWHIDYWRTFIGSAKFGYGLVQKRPRGDVDPIQKVDYRYRLAGDFIPITLPSSVYGTNSYWVLMTVTQKVGTKSTRRVMCIPIDSEGTSSRFVKSGSDAAIECPTIQDFIGGTFEEKLGVSATSISSVAISPIPPLAIEGGDGTTADLAYVINTKIEKKDTSVTYTGRTDYKRVVGINPVIKGGTTTTQSYIELTWSDGSTSQSEKGTSYIRYSIPQYCFNFEGGYGKTYSDSECKVTQTVDGSEYPYTFIKIDDLITVSGITVPSGASLTLDGVKDIWTSVSWGTSSGKLTDLKIPVTVAGAIATRTFTRSDSGSWGQYWVACNPDAMPTFKIVIGGISGEVVQGVENGYAFSSTDRYQEFTCGCDLLTTDTSEVVLTDFTGLPVLSLPWGLHRTSYTVRVIITATSSYLEVRFDSNDSKANGTCGTITLPTVDITSNAWSEYVYSGQRDYDIQQRKLAAQQALVSGITSAMGSAFQTGVLGGVGQGGASEAQIAQLQQMMMRQYRGDKGASMISGIVGGGASTALRSGIGMLGMSLAGTAVDYLTTKYFNGKLQDAEDELKAKQTESIITPGSGWDWLYFGRMPGFITLVPDDYSLNRFAQNIAFNGVSCSEPTSDCTSLVKAGGPLQIANLIVAGNIPVQAKNYIANKIANGVRIK